MWCYIKFTFFCTVFNEVGLLVWISFGYLLSVMLTCLQFTVNHSVVSDNIYHCNEFDAWVMDYKNNTVVCMIWLFLSFLPPRYCGPTKSSGAIRTPPRARQTPPEIQLLNVQKGKNCTQITCSVHFVTYKTNMEKWEIMSEWYPGSIRTVSRTQILYLFQ